MNSYITENQFLAPISQYQAYKQHGVVRLEAHENYQKRSFRNKCIIDGPNGAKSIHIPLSKGKNDKQPIKEVKISYDTNWKRLHLQTFKSNYGSAPYFEYVYEAMEQIYINNHKFLYDFNLELLMWTLEFLDLDIDLNQTDAYHNSAHYLDSTDGRNSIHPKNYHLAINEQLAKPYEQVFSYKHNFLSNLSIIDLIFCCGKESILYLS